MRRKIVILLGHPGAGKGTQARAIMHRLDIPQISTGDMLREAVARKTSYGREAKARMDAGELVSDSVVNGIVAERILRDDCEKGFILDGFPRTLVQAEKLDNLVGGGNGSRNLRVLQLLVPDDVIVKRIALRRSCPECGAIYHLETAPPANDLVCDRCGAEVVARPDDTEQAVRKRLESFHRQTLPVATFYKTKSILREVDGVGPVDEVFERIERSLQ